MIKESSLVFCLSSTIGKGGWFFDNGSSCHMLGPRDLFTHISKGDIALHVELGKKF